MGESLEGQTFDDSVLIAQRERSLCLSRKWHRLYMSVQAYGFNEREKSAQSAKFYLIEVFRPKKKPTDLMMLLTFEIMEVLPFARNFLSPLNGEGWKLKWTGIARV